MSAQTMEATVSPTPAPARPRAFELPMLAGITKFFSWIEHFLVIISGPLLQFGMIVAVVDLFTDGKLLINAPWLLYMWGIAQTVGIDGQLVGAWAEVGDSFRTKNWWAVAGYAILGSGLAYVAYVATYVFTVQQSYSITTQEALSQLGIGQYSWIFQRVIVAVALVCLSGLLRYRAPVQEQVSIELQEQQLRDKAHIRAVKAELAKQALQDTAGVLKGGLGAMRRPVMAMNVSDSSVHRVNETLPDAAVALPIVTAITPPLARQPAGKLSQLNTRSGERNNRNHQYNPVIVPAAN